MGSYQNNECPEKFIEGFKTFNDGNDIKSDRELWCQLCGIHGNETGWNMGDWLFTSK